MYNKNIFIRQITALYQRAHYDFLNMVKVIFSNISFKNDYKSPPKQQALNIELVKTE